MPDKRDQKASSSENPQDLAHPRARWLSDLDMPHSASVPSSGLGLGKTPKLDQLTAEQRHVLRVVAEETGLELDHLQNAKPAQIDLVASAARTEATRIPNGTADDGLRTIVKKWLAEPYVRNNTVGFGRICLSK